MIKKADIILFAAILILGLIVSWLPLAGGEADSVSVTAGDRLYGVYPLAEDREIEIADGDHINHITIKDGAVSMASSSCANQVCVNTGAISRAGQTIVCLPNRIVVEITSKGGGEVDVVTG